MNSAKAIRIARALADVSQRELAARISVDASLISMFESGKREPNVKTLENIAKALDLPFHLFVLLGMDPKARTQNAKDVERLAIGLTKLLFGENDDGERQQRNIRNREAQHSQPKTPGTPPRGRTRKAG